MPLSDDKVCESAMFIPDVRTFGGVGVFEASTGKSSADIDDCECASMPSIGVDGDAVSWFRSRFKLLLLLLLLLLLPLLHLLLLVVLLFNRFELLATLLPDELDEGDDVSAVAPPFDQFRFLWFRIDVVVVVALADGEEAAFRIRKSILFRSHCEQVLSFGCFATGIISGNDDECSNLIAS